LTDSDEYHPAGTTVFDQLMILGHPEEMEHFVQQTAADEVLVVPDALTWEGLQQIVRTITVRQPQTTVRLSPGIYEILTTGLNLSDRAGVPLLTLAGVRITGFAAIAKNIGDYSSGRPFTAFCGAAHDDYSDSHLVYSRHPHF